MANYLSYMQNISNRNSSSAKSEYIKYNFSAFVQPQMSVLEVGPGLRDFLRFIQSRLPSRVDIIDRDPATLEFIKSEFKPDKALELSAEEIASNTEKLNNYDLVFLLQIVEHVETAALIPLLKALYDRLNPDGYIIITVPNANNPLAIVERYSDITHINPFSTNSLTQIGRTLRLKEF